MFKKFLELIQSYEDVPFSPFVLDEILLVQTIIITFIYLFALFIVQNFKKILGADPELWACTISGPKMVYLPYTIIFFGKN